MRLVDASSLIDPSAENLASPGLAEQAQRPPYAASPTRSLFNHGGLTCNPVTESEMSEEGETTSVVHHLQRDSDNHSECDLLLDMAGGMILSPPRPGMNFSDEEALQLLTPDFHIDMGGGMMMSMNYFSLPSGDSFGNSNPFRLWNFADDSEVQELENRKGMMMPPQLCIEGVDAVLGQKNQSLGIWAAENIGLVQQSCWGTHPQPQTTDDGYSVNNVDEWFQLAGGMMNYSLPSHDSLPLSLGGNFEPYRFWDDGAYSVGHELHNRERIMRMTASRNAVDSELFFYKEFWLNIEVQAMENGLPVAHTDVNLFCKFKYTSFSLIEVKVGIRGAWIAHNSVTESPSSGQSGVYTRALFEFLEEEFGDTSNSVQQPIIAHFKLASLENLDKLFAELEKIVNLDRLLAELEKTVNLDRLAAEFKKSHTVCILPALLEAACRMMQLDSPCEPHFPKSSAATNEETNNRIDDAKGGNSSSKKTGTISRWEKDHGINHQVLQQLFGKSREDAAKTLKVSTSTFKRACRNFGINRWPNHSKGKMPNCSLNQKQHVQAVKKHERIQPCPALPPLQATNTSQCNNTMSVKVTYKNDTIRFPLSSSSTIKYLEEQLETKFKISLQNFSIKYQDEEDEWITLTCDSELMHGMEVLGSCGKTVIRMMVTPKFN